MELRQYLFDNRMTVRDFARRVNYIPLYVSGVKNFTKWPGRKLKEAIYNATDGLVDYDESHMRILFEKAQEKRKELALSNKTNEKKAQKNNGNHKTEHNPKKRIIPQPTK